MSNFKEKYLKYKNKYLLLKGGLICHNNPNTQHLGECWHDNIVTQFIYGELIGEQVQRIILERIDKNDYYEYVADLINKAKRSEQIFLLLNFDLENEEDTRFLERNLALYLKNVALRFERLNKLSPIKRQQSAYDMSKSCVIHLFKLFNRNRIQRQHFNKRVNKHGTTYFEQQYVALVLSFLFLKNQFINFRIINYKDKSSILEDGIIVRDKFNNIITKDIVDNCNSIIFIAKFDEFSDHSISLLNINCDDDGKKLYLFDNNNWNSQEGTLSETVISIIGKKYNNWKELIKDPLFLYLKYNFNFDNYSEFTFEEDTDIINIKEVHLLELIDLRPEDISYEKFIINTFFYYFAKMMLEYNVSKYIRLKFKDILLGWEKNEATLTVPDD